MACEALCIYGESGTGKTTSLRNMNPESTFIISTTGKPLSFKGWKKKYIPFKIDKEIALNFHGGINMWAELPLPNDIYDYDKYITPDYLLNNEKTTDDYEEIEEDKSQKNNFKLII